LAFLYLGLFHLRAWFSSIHLLHDKFMRSCDCYPSITYIGATCSCWTIRCCCNNEHFPLYPFFVHSQAIVRRPGVWVTDNVVRWNHKSPGSHLLRGPDGYCLALLMRWAGHVARMGEQRSAYRILMGNHEGKRPLGRPRRR
jgi:hypothetical protein